MSDLDRVRDATFRHLAEERQKTAEEMARRAKYKIQIVFTTERSTWKPMAYSLSFWESGKRLHGGGDECMFICRRHADAPRLAPFAAVQGFKRTPTDQGCGYLIPGDGPDGLLVCPHCGATHKTTEVGDSIFYRTTAQRCAGILAEWWRKLNCDADIYAKHRDDDPRTQAMAKVFGWQAARLRRGLVIYPLANILKDTAAGAEVEGRFKVFVTG